MTPARTGQYIHKSVRCGWRELTQASLGSSSTLLFCWKLIEGTLAWGSMTPFLVYKPSCLCLSDPSDWLYRPCAGNDDCVENNSECYNGRCICTPGYYYSVSSKTCVACELSTYTSVACICVPTLSFCHIHFCSQPAVLSHALLLHLLVLPQNQQTRQLISGWNT